MRQKLETFPPGNFPGTFFGVFPMVSLALQKSSASKAPSSLVLAASVAVAAVLWFFSFYVALGNFWIKIACSAACLACLAAYFGERPSQWFAFTKKDLLWGLASAAALYFIFFVGNAVSRLLFSFADTQVGGLYQKGEGTGAGLILPILLFVTGPCEEIYWRGFLQKNLMERLGPHKGIALATVLYALVNLPAKNFMLMGAAVVAGLFWGFMFLKLGRVPALIISHSVWGVVIFAVFPIA